MVKIQDGTGSGREAQIDSNNRLSVRSLIETEAEGATDIGNSYIISTGAVSLSTTADSAVLYVKNNEEQVLVIAGLSIGIGSGTLTDSPAITVVRNPTLGTIISDASPVEINQNRNFGSSQTLTVDAFKGSDGKTFTNGNDAALFFQAANGQLFLETDFELTKGDSIGIRISPKVDASPLSIYAELSCHLKEIE